MSPSRQRICKMEINHREVSFPEGVTVLRAAELNDIYIPSLCSHKDLSPFGGCRLCLVEIEGMRGYPLACSTLAAEGMKVLTDTAAVREMRKEILQLILSEHPSSCLICTEQQECRENQYTIRKAGVTTGCRYCPNDRQCELQALVEKIGITDIEYPVIYRGYEAEHDDPFYDRDYNVCILCGRCVRMCQEVRGTGVLAFKFRGPRTQIGPAFGKNHVEAGCEFCGACVDVCPTGTLADKVSKWDGLPDGSEVSTCPFCPIGCQLELFHKDGRLSRAAGHLDPEVNDGQLCVRGRFCLPEMTHHFSRARKPMLRRGKYFREVTWHEALGEVAEKLKGVKPGELLMVVSGDLTNEGLYTAQKFVRTCLKSNNIDSTARHALAGGLELWTRLFCQPISIQAIRQADAIVAVGLDSRFYFSVAGVEIRHALKAGATLVTIDARDSNLARYTDHWLRPVPGQEGTLLKAIADSLDSAKPPPGGIAAAVGVEQVALERAVATLLSAGNLAVVLGPTVFTYDANEQLTDGLLKLAKRKNTTILPLYNGANTRGALELGVLGAPLPDGLESGPAEGRSMTLADVLAGRANPKVLYLVGEVPFFRRPDCEYLIVQNIYRPSFEVDAFLPAASFAEAEGTLTNVEGRVQKLIQIEKLPDGAVTGATRPDWHIFSRLAQKLGFGGFEYEDANAVLKEISKSVPGFPAQPDRKPRPIRQSAGAAAGRSLAAAAGAGRSNRAWCQSSAVNCGGEYLLVAEPGGFAHRGTDLSAKVEGLAELALEEGFRMNPEDLRRLGLSPGQHVAVSVGRLTAVAEARADPECPQGVIYYHRPTALNGLEHRADLEPLYRLETNPTMATVQAARLTEAKPKTSSASRRTPAAAN